MVVVSSSRFPLCWTPLYHFLGCPTYGLRLGIRLPIVTGRTSEGASQIEFTETGVSTNIDIHEGQKVIAGKASIGGTKDALFPVLAAKVVN